MVSLLIVSHSALIAAGVQELAMQMGGADVAVAAAGGTLEGEIGTSSERIANALATLPTADGVLVLVDLGSAVMYAEMALEDSGLRYLISNAPLVEGAVFAAAQASVGATLEQVAAEAEKACQLIKVQ